MNYPNGIKKSFNKVVSHANRGMELENLINMTNENYVDKNIALIYKKPTPIQVVKYNYNTKRIDDAFYLEHSTLDYNGVYKGYYIEFDAKNTNKNYLPLANIATHQLKHIENVLKHKGIVFLIIMINNKCYALSGIKLLNYIKSSEKKSIPYEYIKENGYEIEVNYLKGIDYIKCVDLLIKEMCDE